MREEQLELNRLDRLDAAENEKWSGYSLGGTTFFDPEEEAEIYRTLFGEKPRPYLRKIPEVDRFYVPLNGGGNDWEG